MTEEIRPGECLFCGKVDRTPDPQCPWGCAIRGGGIPNPQPWIRCPQCGYRSYNPNDVREKYCGNCHQFHDAMGVR